MTYASPDGLPRLQCPHCNNSAWILNECEPGKDSVVDCSVCGFQAAIGIRGTVSPAFEMPTEMAHIFTGAVTHQQETTSENIESIVSAGTDFVMDESLDIPVPPLGISVTGESIETETPSSPESGLLPEPPNTEESPIPQPKPSRKRTAKPSEPSPSE